MDLQTYNPHEHAFSENCEVYATIVRAAPESVRKFLYDVQTLEGKLPNGTFKRQLFHSESSLLDGFNGNDFHVYLEILPGCVAERIHYCLHLTHLCKEVKGIKQLTTREGKKEMKICRESAILGTLAILMPQFNELFIPQARRFRYIVQPVCMPKR